MGSGMTRIRFVQQCQKTGQRWLFASLLASGLFLLALPAVPGGGLGISVAAAQDIVQVQVDVVQGTKGAQGVDASASKHQAVVSRISGFGGWKLVQGLPLKIAPGKTSQQSVGDRKLSVTVHSVAGGKAKTTVVVTDPNGKPHKVTSALGSGGTTVLTAESAGGDQVHLFVVSVSW